MGMGRGQGGEEVLIEYIYFNIIFRIQNGKRPES